MTSKHPIISNPEQPSNSAKRLTSSELNRMYADIQSKFTAILFALKTRAKSAQDYTVSIDLFETAFRLCHSPEQQLELLNSWLKDGH